MNRYDVNDEDIISDFKAGVSLRQLAAKYGMSVRAIQYRLDRNGVERRDSSLTKITICENCEKPFEQPIWGRRSTCNGHCMVSLCYKRRKIQYKRTMEYKYPWGTYVYRALQSLCDYIVTVRGDRHIIPFSDFSYLYRDTFGVNLADPSLKEAIITYMETKGYVYEVYRFRKKKGIRGSLLPEVQRQG